MKNDETKVFEVPLRVDPQDGKAPCSMPQVQKPEVADGKSGKVGRIACVYTLSDPRDGAIRYVGRTSKPLKKRLCEHVSESKSGSRRSYKCNWINKVISDGFYPVITRISDWVTEEETFDLEPRFISMYREHGCKLTNMCDGGGVNSGIVFSDERRMAISNRMKMRWSDPVHRIQLLKSTDIKSRITPEVRAKITASHRGKKRKKFTRRNPWRGPGFRSMETRRNQQASILSRLASKSTHGFFGVSSQSKRLFMVKITVNGSRVSVATGLTSAFDAAIAYDNYVVKSGMYWMPVNFKEIL